MTKKKGIISLLLIVALLILGSYVALFGIERRRNRLFAVV